MRSASTTAAPREDEDDPDVAPLSRAQWRHWLLETSGKLGDAFNVPVLLRLEGALDLRRLRRAVAFLMCRHAMLRVAYPVLASRPTQVVGHALQTTMPLIDLGGTRAAGSRDPLAEPGVAKIMRAASERPFDLHNGPLFFACVFRIRADLHCLLLNLHHSICDAWSLRILARDFSRFYGMQDVRAAEQLPSEDRRYLEYARTSDAAPAAARAHWRKVLEGARPYVPITGTDGDPSATGGGLVRSWVRGRTLERLLQCCRSNRITLFVFLQAAMHLLLRALTGRDDQLTGTVVAGRGDPDLSDVVGCFAEPLPIRIASLDAATIADLIQVVRRAVFDALSHQCSFDDIVGAATVRGDDRRNPLFNVAVLVQNTRDAMASGITALESLRVSPVTAPPIAPSLDLRLVAMETADAIELCWEFDRTVISPKRMAVMAKAFDDLVDDLLDPGATVDQCLATLEASLAPLAAFTVNVVSSLPATPLADGIERICARIGIACKVILLPERDLATAGSLTEGLVVFLLDPADWHAAGEAMAQRIADRLLAIRARCLVVEVVDDAGDAAAEWAAGVRARIGSLPPGLSWIKQRVAKEAVEYPPDSGLRYGPLLYAAAALTASKEVFRAYVERAPFKALVLDCDGVLWKGIVGEVGASGVVIDDARCALQSFALERYRAGLILCLCSRNNPADVDAVFSTRPEMVLDYDLISARRVGWRPKSAMITELAQELAFDLESLIFVDDDPAQIVEVKRHCPAVTTILLDPATLHPERLLEHHWAFSTARYSSSARQRQAHYRDEGRRREARASAGGLADFVEFLQVAAEHRPCSAAERDRLFELLVRTNQFNATGERPSRTDLERELETGQVAAIVTNVNDRFADYGLVGAVLYEESEAEVVVRNVVLSCRALGRGVELSMMKAVAGIAGRRNIRVRYRETGRNVVALAFIDVLREIAAMREPQVLVLQADAVLGAPLARLEVATAPAVVHAAEARRGVDFCDEALTSIARCADDAAAIHAWVGCMGDDAADEGGAATHSSALLWFWRRALSSEHAQPNRSFFQQGGSSMRAVEMLTQVRARLGINVPIADFFAAPYLSTIARFVQAPGASSLPSTVSPQAPIAALPLQEAISNAELLDREMGSYHLSIQLAFAAAWGPEALQDAIRAWFRRHQVMRARFVEADGRLCQFLDSEPSVGVCDLRALPFSALGKAQEQVLAAMRAKAFAVDQRTPARALVVVGPARCRMHIVLHRLVCDARSIRVLLDELSHILRAGLGDAGLPAAPDYVRQCMSVANAYQPAGPGGWEAPAFIPSEHDSEAQAWPRSEVKLPLACSARLMQFGRQVGVRPDLVVIALAGLSYMHAGRTHEVVVATGADVRGDDLAALVGPFSATALTAVEFDASCTFREFVARLYLLVGAATARALAYARGLPASPVHDQRLPPSAQLSVAYDLKHATSEPGAGLWTEEGPAGAPWPRGAVAFRLCETADGIMGSVMVSPAHASAISARCVARRFEELAAEMLADPDIAISEPALSPPGLCSA